MVSIVPLRAFQKLCLVLLEPLDEPVGRAVVVEFGVGLGKFRKDLLGELLAEFNTPLVVTVDVPDNALGEDLVFVHGDEGTERFRRNVVHHDGVGRLVAFEHLVRGEECDFLFALAVLAEFFLGLGERLAVHQGFGLCKEVAEQLLVVVADLVVAVCRGDEVARNHLGALVDELVEGVLAVGTRFAPEDRTRLVVHALAVTVNGLAVRFHVCLLEVGGEAVEVLVVREHGVAGSAEEVVVPNADEGEDDREVLVSRSGLEMLIHFVCSLVELHVVFEADAESDGLHPLGVPAHICAVGLYCKVSRFALRYDRATLATAPQCRPKGSLSLTRMLLLKQVRMCSHADHF